MHGFARTIQRNADLGEPLSRYVEMIAAAAVQMTELLETVSLASRIESHRYDPTLMATDTLHAARDAAAKLDSVDAEGSGEAVETDADALTRSLAAFALCARRHGGVPEVTIAVQGRTFTISPIGSAGPILVGDELRDVGAAVAVRAIAALGGSVGVEADSLVVRV